MDDSLCAHHRDGPAGLHVFFLKYAVYFEGALGKVDDCSGVHQAVALLGSEHKFEIVTDFLAGDVLFELGKEISHTVDELQGFFGCRAVGYFSVDLELIAEVDYFLVFNFHYCIVIVCLGLCPANI